MVWRAKTNPCYIVAVGSTLNQPSLSSLSHHQPYFLVIEFFFRATRSPVDVTTVLELSGGDSGFALACFRACAQAAVEPTAALAFHWILSAEPT